jgi:hypothetical protein
MLIPEAMEAPLDELLRQADGLRPEPLLPPSRSQSACSIQPSSEIIITKSSNPHAAAATVTPGTRLKGLHSQNLLFHLQPFGNQPRCAWLVWNRSPELQTACWQQFLALQADGHRGRSREQRERFPARGGGLGHAPGASPSLRAALSRLVPVLPAPRLPLLKFTACLQLWVAQYCASIVAVNAQSVETHRSLPNCPSQPA